VKYPLIAIDQIPEEGTVLLPFSGRDVQVYKQNGTPVAVANTCMHFGGPLECREGKFVCAWHGAEFALEDGRRLAAPAPAASRLMFLSTTIEDGVLHYIWGEA
jgi:nitrite reductase/ring-hydroxylating ferredoxin subunit